MYTRPSAAIVGGSGGPEAGGAVGGTVGETAGGRVGGTVGGSVGGTVGDGTVVGLLVADGITVGDETAVAVCSNDSVVAAGWVAGPSVGISTTGTGACGVAVASGKRMLQPASVSRPRNITTRIMMVFISCSSGSCRHGSDSHLQRTV